MYTLVRFIPAYAGNTLGIATIVASPSVYPRIRGEHLISAGRLSYANGLSPHTRGTRVRQNLSNLNRRFIPAYAGNTALPPISSHAPAVYPRIRGEHVIQHGEMLVNIGLSPHTRGTHKFSCRPVPEKSVYPRIRGEHASCLLAFFINSGLSPHTRGTLPAQPAPPSDRRFIPAYAGNTLASGCAYT